MAEQIADALTVPSPATWSALAPLATRALRLSAPYDEDHLDALRARAANADARAGVPSPLPAHVSYVLRRIATGEGRNVPGLTLLEAANVVRATKAWIEAVESSMVWNGVLRPHADPSADPLD